MYFKKDADSFEPSELLLGRPDPMPAKSHSFFLWLAMFNLTIFQVRQNSTVFPFPNTGISLILEDKLVVELPVSDNQLYAGYCPGAFLHILISVNVSPGHQWDRKKVRKQHFCLQNFVAFININDRIQYIESQLLSFHFSANY